MTTEHPKTEQWLRAGAAARIIGVTPATLRSFIDQLVVRRLRREFRYRRDSIEDLACDLEDAV